MANAIPMRQSRTNQRDHDQTPTTKSVTKIENELKKMLGAIYDAVKRDISITSSGVGVSFTTIRSFYEVPARDLLRAAITEMYIEAARYVTLDANKIPFFLTETDIAVMRKISEEFMLYYWKGLEDELIRKLARAFDHVVVSVSKELQQHLPLSDTFIDRLVESLGSRVMAEATISKTQQIADARQQQQQTRTAQLIPEGYDPLEFLNLYQPSSFLYGAFLNVVKSTRLVWMTARDERVCPICAPLHGTTYDINDPTIPIPVMNTHIRCRCRLMVVDSESGGVVMK